MTKRLSQGRFAIYWYAFRGGPLLIKFEGDSEVAATEAERRGAPTLAASYAVSRSRPQSEKLHVRDLVALYKAAPDGFLRLGKSTRGEWLRWLDRIVGKFGDLPLSALRAKGAKAIFLDWRDSLASTPRAADYGMQVLKRLFSWATERQHIDRNPVEGVAGLYKNNRADVIVEDEELQQILLHATESARHAIGLAAATGMRRGDLVRLKWSHIGETSIMMETSKSGGSRRIVVPLLPETKVILERLRERRARTLSKGKVPSSFVLTTRYGSAWTEDAVTQAFIRARDKAGVEGKHLHDLRGTAVTRLALAQITDEEIADIVGWGPSESSQHPQTLRGSRPDRT